MILIYFFMLGCLSNSGNRSAKESNFNEIQDEKNLHSAIVSGNVDLLTKTLDKVSIDNSILCAALKSNRDDITKLVLDKFDHISGNNVREEDPFCIALANKSKLVQDVLDKYNHSGFACINEKRRESFLEMLFFPEDRDFETKQSLILQILDRVTFEDIYTVWKRIEQLPDNDASEVNHYQASGSKNAKLNILKTNCMMCYYTILDNIEKKYIEVIGNNQEVSGHKQEVIGKRQKDQLSNLEMLKCEKEYFFRNIRSIVGIHYLVTHSNKLSEAERQEQDKIKLKLERELSEKMSVLDPVFQFYYNETLSEMQVKYLDIIYNYPLEKPNSEATLNEILSNKKFFQVRIRNILNISSLNMVFTFSTLANIKSIFFYILVLQDKESFAKAKNIFPPSELQSIRLELEKYFENIYKEWQKNQEYVSYCEINEAEVNDKLGPRTPIIPKASVKFRDRVLPNPLDDETRKRSMSDPVLPISELDKTNVNPKGKLEEKQVIDSKVVKSSQSPKNKVSKIKAVLNTLSKVIPGRRRSLSFSDSDNATSAIIKNGELVEKSNSMSSLVKQDDDNNSVYNQDIINDQDSIDNEDSESYSVAYQSRSMVRSRSLTSLNKIPTDTLKRDLAEISLTNESEEFQKFPKKLPLVEILDSKISLESFKKVIIGKDLSTLLSGLSIGLDAFNAPTTKSSDYSVGISKCQALASHIITSKTGSLRDRTAIADFLITGLDSSSKDTNMQKSLYEKNIQLLDYLIQKAVILDKNVENQEGKVNAVNIRAVKINYQDKYRNKYQVEANK